MKAKKDDITHKLKIARGQIHTASVRAGFIKERKSTDSTGTYPKLCPGGFANRRRKSEAGGSPETT